MIFNQIQKTPKMLDFSGYRALITRRSLVQIRFQGFAQALPILAEKVPLAHFLGFAAARIPATMHFRRSVTRSPDLFWFSRGLKGAFGSNLVQDSHRSSVAPFSIDIYTCLPGVVFSDDEVHFRRESDWLFWNWTIIAYFGLFDVHRVSYSVLR